MIDKGIFPTNIDPFLNKTWSIREQSSVFSANYIPSNQPISNIIEPVIIPNSYTDIILKNGLLLEGEDLTSSLLNQALEYFQKALYNFKTHYLLAENGYKTWSSVTNYYSSYFSLFSLLSLQGRFITRVKLDGVKETICLLHPFDFKKHIYILTTKGNNERSHRLPWRKYYDIYNSYGLLKQDFDVIQQKKYVTEAIDESEERNKVNYKIFEGFQEVVSLNSVQTFKTEYLNALSSPILGEPLDNYISSLKNLATDPTFKYFARSALRLILIRTIFEEICHNNINFKQEFTSRISIWQSTLFNSYDPPINYFEGFISTFID